MYENINRALEWNRKFRKKFNHIDKQDKGDISNQCSKDTARPEEPFGTSWSQSHTSHQTSRQTQNDQRSQCKELNCIAYKYLIQENKGEFFLAKS